MTILVGMRLHSHPRTGPCGARATAIICTIALAFSALARTSRTSQDGCESDLDGSGTVDGADLSLLLSQWGPCPSGKSCEADLTDDGSVNGADLGIVLAEWGDCASNCIPAFHWSDEFLVNGVSGAAPIWDMVVFDDGDGPAVYAAFTGQGSARVAPNHRLYGIAKWDGSRWSPLADGLSGGAVLSLAVHDDGSGLSLFAAGSFTHAGAIATGPIARWDGVQWYAVGQGIEGGSIRGLEPTTDGDSPALYMARSTPSDGGEVDSSVLCWRGLRGGWSSVGDPLTGTIRDLAILHSDDEPILYAGGDFSSSGQAALHGIAKTNLAGTSGWDPVGDGVTPGTTVYKLHVHSDNNGTALYVGGSFNSAGPVNANRIARWDGHAWSALAEGVSGVVTALHTFDDGSGLQLYVGGHFNSAGGATRPKLARWNGTVWSNVDAGLPASAPYGVYALAGVDTDHSGHSLAGTLFIGSNIYQSANQTYGHIAQFRESRVRPLGHDGPDGFVNALLVADHGPSGSRLVVGGSFASAGDVPVNNLAVWDGGEWTSIGNIAGSSVAAVTALALYNSGAGNDLYVGGIFNSAGGLPALGIARWDGTDWHQVGGGVNGQIRAMQVHDDGSGAALYVAGDFTLVSDPTIRDIAKWDGKQWSALGSGLSAADVYALTVMDDGSGPALFAGGQFSIPGQWSSKNIAKWTGGAWEPLGDGLGTNPGDAVWSLCGLETANGTTLYAGGTFNGPGFSLAKLARWSGTVWEPISMPGTVTAMSKLQTPGGPVLVAAAWDSGVWLYDGSDWRQGISLNSAQSPNSDVVLALACTSIGREFSIYVGGRFDETFTYDLSLMWSNLCSLRSMPCDGGSK